MISSPIADTTLPEGAVNMKENINREFFSEWEEDYSWPEQMKEELGASSSSDEENEGKQSNVLPPPAGLATTAPLLASTLGFVLACLVSVCYFSFTSVVSYISLALLVIVIGIKIYSYAMVFLKKADPSNDPSVELRRLFLLENGFDSIKFVLYRALGELLKGPGAPRGK